MHFVTIFCKIVYRIGVFYLYGWKLGISVSEETKERYLLAALSEVPGFGSRRLRRLLEAFPAAELWRIPVEEMREVEPSAALRGRLAAFRAEHPDEPERLRERCEKAGAAVCTIHSAVYPDALREIFDPPIVLYYRGTMIPDARRVAMVGSRRCSSYGEGIAQHFARDFVAAGLTVVSGAARGIDTNAHKGALRGGGRTAAVLGCGIDIAYPRENRRLLEEIAEHGVVISEYGPGVQPLPAFFPARNRIISGLSEGTLVVEAARRSGSLITAELALSEGRNVYAVPGSIWSASSAGCHHLIQQGAKLVTAPLDVLEDYGVEAVPSREKRLSLSPEERKIWQVLSFDHYLTPDEIVLSLPDGDIANLPLLLLQMELKGLILQNDLHAYRRAERE